LRCGIGSLRLLDICWEISASLLLGIVVTRQLCTCAFSKSMSLCGCRCEVFLIDDYVAQAPKSTRTQVNTRCILLNTFSTTAMHVINNNSAILQRRRSKSGVNTIQRSSSHQELHRFLLTGQLYESTNCTIAGNTQQHHRQDRDLQSTSFRVP
jgi:hypothetical protein